MTAMKKKSIDTLSCSLIGLIIVFTISFIACLLFSKGLKLSQDATGFWMFVSIIGAGVSTVFLKAVEKIPVY